ncbi:hypothetical protein CNR33_00078 [Pseudomonas phage tabernarius]|uniref:Uncharacterized protein n=1 Tax=Pseudomonas phage tabernarius TaxID=2048978 RepID=A0A2H4P6W3_9CAUD|nr:hypothetical protein FDJ17_gp78 [Pseudomonas phage tabernarius]ATW57924.1 hypothetical protein CNR33_00078 [Pseudomonas phage tabernarius]
MSQQTIKRNPVIRVICLQVVTKRELVVNAEGQTEVQDETKVYRFSAETSLQLAFDTVKAKHPKALFIEVYEPISCALTAERL